MTAYAMGFMDLLQVTAARGDRIEIDLASIVGYVIVGLIVGALARFLVPGRDPVGLLGTLVIGVIGAIGGGWLAGAVFEETAGVDWVASVLVAIVLVLLVRAAAGRRGIL
ncbi:MAG TPA: GlsB/YeaQ/YmgE family stress response membrane protein [Actinomycetota bacterium]|nr:GlsB/YeaQ/YmgE family stress response membrane protein [Actinomycetota bacterium]